MCWAIVEKYLSAALPARYAGPSPDLGLFPVQNLTKSIGDEGGFLSHGAPKSSKSLDHDFLVKPMVTWVPPTVGNPKWGSLAYSSKKTCSFHDQESKFHQHHGKQNAGQSQSHSKNCQEKQKKQGAMCHGPIPFILRINHSSYQILMIAGWAFFPVDQSSLDVSLSFRHINQIFKDLMTCWNMKQYMLNTSFLPLDYPLLGKLTAWLFGLIPKSQWNMKIPLWALVLATLSPVAVTIDVLLARFFAHWLSAKLSRTYKTPQLLW